MENIVYGFKNLSHDMKPIIGKKTYQYKMGINEYEGERKLYHSGLHFYPNIYNADTTKRTFLCKAYNPIMASDNNKGVTNKLELIKELHPIDILLKKNKDYVTMFEFLHEMCTNDIPVILTGSILWSLIGFQPPSLIKDFDLVLPYYIPKIKDYLYYDDLRSESYLFVDEKLYVTSTMNTPVDIFIKNNIKYSKIKIKTSNNRAGYDIFVQNLEKALEYKAIITCRMNCDYKIDNLIKILEKKQSIGFYLPKEIDLEYDKKLLYYEKR